MKNLGSARITEFRNNNFSMWVEDGIFHLIVLKDSFTLKMAEECVRERIKITQGKSYPMLSDSRNVINFDKEARKYLAQKD
ncbi:MAG: hypothetical protein WD431_19265 [Cyclobacteriaceae bacterium]